MVKLMDVGPKIKFRVAKTAKFKNQHLTLLKHSRKNKNLLQFCKKFLTCSAQRSDSVTVLLFFCCRGLFLLSDACSVCGRKKKKLLWG